MHRGIRILAAIAALTLCGCGSMGGFRQIASAIFTPATLADALTVGFSAGPAEEIAELDDAKEALKALGFLPVDTMEELEGVIFPLAIRDEQDLREVLCIGEEMAEKCRLVPLNTEVRISGRTTADGKIVPVTLSWDRRP